MPAQPYLIQNVDAKGRRSPPIEIMFDEAIDAVDYANRQRIEAHIELWKGGELIARLKPKSPPPRFSH
jgi:hypothetical protein